MGRKDPRWDEARREIRRLRRYLRLATNAFLFSETKAQEKYFMSRINNLRERIGWLLLDCRDYAKGLAMYQALPWNTRGEQKYNGIARALIEMEMYDQALPLLERGLRRFPESHCLHVAMGMLHYRLGEYNDALRYFDKALTLEAGDRHSLYDKALCLDRLGYYEDGYEILSSLVDEYDDDPEYHEEIGYCHFVRGYSEDAIKSYSAAKDLGYLSPDVYYGLFCSYLDLGMKHEAIDIAQEGLREFPDEPGMYQNLGVGYLRMGWRDEARDVVLEGLRKHPDDEDLKELLEDIEDDDDDDDDRKRPLIGLIAYLLLLMKKRREKR